MQSRRKRFRPDLWSLLLGSSLVLSPSIKAADEPMKLGCRYESASLSDSGKDKGYAIDCRNRTDDRLVGAILIAGADHASTLSRVLGFIAVTAATINAVGGFLITDRMLKMFKRRDDKEKR
jgi:hypothetical protein